MSEEEKEKQEILDYLEGLMNRIKGLKLKGTWEAVTWDIEKHLYLPLDVSGMEE